MQGVPPDAAQECRVSVPVIAILPDGRTLTGLRSGDFEVRIAGGRAELQAAELDTAPKRVVLLLDASRQVNEEGWRVVIQLASFVARTAASEDRLALVVYGAAGALLLDFNQPREAILQKLEALSAARPPKPAERGHFHDSLLAAAEIFGPPAFGDTVLALFGGADRGSRANPARVKEVFLARGIRLYGIALDRAVIGFIVGGVFSTAILHGLSELDQLAVDTGGFFAHEDIRPVWKTYKLTDERQRELEVFLRRTMLNIVRPYRLELLTQSSRKLERTDVQLGVESARKVARVELLYPRLVQTCAIRGE